MVKKRQPQKEGFIQQQFFNTSLKGLGRATGCSLSLSLARKGKIAAGFTLVEYLIYIALFSVVAIAITSLAVQFIQVSRETNALKEIEENARIVMDALSQEIKQATSIYSPTSVFGVNLSQISLETKTSLPPQETATYVDFYLDGNGIYRKREGETATRLTSQDVEVTNFTVLLLSQAQTPALRIDLSLDSKGLSGEPFSFATTVSLRSN